MKKIYLLVCIISILLLYSCNSCETIIQQDDQNIISHLNFNYNKQYIYYTIADGSSLNIKNWMLKQYNVDTNEIRIIAQNAFPINFAVNNKYIYYIDYDTDKNLYLFKQNNKIDTNNRNKLIKINNEISNTSYKSFIKIVNTDIFILDGYDLIKISNNKSSLLQSQVSSINIYDKIYFIDDYQKLCTLDLNGENLQCLVTVDDIYKNDNINSKWLESVNREGYITDIILEDENIFFLYKAPYTNGILYKCDLNGKNITPIPNLYINQYQIRENKIFFSGGIINNSENLLSKNMLYKCNLDGTDIKILNQEVFGFCMTPNKIYFNVLNGASEHLYSIDWDGKNKNLIDSNNL